MGHTQDLDVIICGAGAAGLTLAIDLARRGVGFLLIEKAAEPFAGSRGKGIQPRTQEVFEDLGVVDRIVASGGEYPVQRFYTDDGPGDPPLRPRRGGGRRAGRRDAGPAAGRAVPDPAARPAVPHRAPAARTPRRA